jgi:hypothetical protein
MWLPAREPEQGSQLLTGRFNRLHLPSLPLGHRTPVDPEPGGELTPGQTGGDPGGLELQRKRSGGWLEWVIAQECDDLRHVLDLRIEAVVFPIVHRGGPNPDSVRHVRLSKAQIDQTLPEVVTNWLREQSELRKKPSTAELVDWISALLRSGISIEKVETHIPFVGALLKKEQDIDALLKYDQQSGRYPKSCQDLGPRYNQ